MAQFPMRADRPRFGGGVHLAAALVVATTVGCTRHETEHRHERPHVAIARLEIPTALVIPWWTPVETTFLHDQLIEALVRTEAFDVVERTRLDTLLEEQQLTKTEITDPNQAAKLGKMLGAEYFIVGTLRTAELAQGDRRLPYTTRDEHTASGRIRFTFRVIEVETSRIVVASTAESWLDARDVNGVDAEQAWRDLQRRAGEQLAHQVLDALVPVEIVRIDGDQVALSRGASTGIVAGQAFDITAPADGDHRLQGGATVGTLEVTDTAPNGATARITTHQTEIRPGMVCRAVAPPEPAAPAARPDPLESRW
jgi:hypothetical protein